MLHNIQQENIHAHTVQQADVTMHTQQRVSSDLTLTPSNRQEEHIQTPAQQRDIAMPTPQMPNYLEANSTTPA